jgi:hypothetical protein
VSATTENLSPMVRRVRAYFAPVNRSTTQPTIFDPAQSLAASSSASQWKPPAPWIDLGWIHNFTRKSETKIVAIKSGAPATTYTQARTDIEATVSFQFESWSKLQLSLSAGTQQMNLLKTTTTIAEGSGGTAIAATPLASGSTATVLQMTATAASAFSVGEWIAVDVDCIGQLGYLGSGVSGAYIRSALTDVDYVRRITLNVVRITAINAGAITLDRPLIAGAPTSAMKVSAIIGFCGREGSSFFQEWSALFVAEGQQGERIAWFYPRLQTMSGAAESTAASSGGYEKKMLAAAFRAIPVIDPIDNETVVCFRSYAMA